MMADFGLTLEHTESVLGLSGAFIDFAKIAVGTARLYPRAYLTNKLDLYQRHQVRPFIGGQFAEYVFATQGRQALPRFFAEAIALGFDTIEISDNCVPLTDAERTDVIGEAIRAGLKVFGETCPQYLMLTEKDLEGLNMEGAKYVCSPPPRDEAAQEACWLGLKTGVFQTFSSDHCPFRYEDPHGKLIPKGRTSFRWVPNGIPGVETRLPILFSEGVVKGRITLNEFVALTATNHAKMYGLAPRKGTIAVGSDADIAVWDPERRMTITAAALHHGADYTPYEGREVTGWPVRTIVRGRTVVADGKLVGGLTHGQHLKRARSPYAVPTGRQVTGFAPAGVHHE